MSITFKVMHGVREIAINSLTSSFFLVLITVGSERERRREEGGIHFYSFLLLSVRYHAYDTSRLFVSTRIYSYEQYILLY